MWSNTFGECFRITTFGESHGPAVGVVIDGVKAGMALDEGMIQADLDRRKPGTTPVGSPRQEPDAAEILSGVFEGVTTGAPICILVRNKDARPGDYGDLKDVFRPGHGDFTWLAKYGVRDWRGGGRLSGRETIGRVAAGAVARKMLEGAGVKVVACTIQAGGIAADAYDEDAIERNPMRCPDPVAAGRMLAVIESAAAKGDSVGGIVQVVARGVPAGWGDPVFWKLDALAAQALMSIGGVKGVEIGAGFAAVGSRGSKNNDPIGPGGFLSNNAGGILGGISNGEPIVARIAIKPTSSISQPQDTVDIEGRPRTLRVRGRHDACLCPRIVPVAEAMLILVLAEAYLRQCAMKGEAEGPLDLAGTRAFLDAELLGLISRRIQLERIAIERGGDDSLEDDEARWMQAAKAAGVDGGIASGILGLVRKGAVKTRPG